MNGPTSWCWILCCRASPGTRCSRSCGVARIPGIWAWCYSPPRRPGAPCSRDKPFSPQELVLRIAAVLRRLASPAVASGSVITAGPLVIDRAAHRVAVEGKEIELTATQYNLLFLLAERRGRVQSRAQLLESVWKANPGIQTRTVDMHMQRLRSKLGAAASFLETVRGFGDRFRSAQTAKRRGA